MATRTAPPKDDRTSSLRAGLTHLRRLRRQLDRLDTLFAARLDTIRELRGMDPPVPWSQIADACGTSEPNLIQLLKKADAAEARRTS